ncbi:protein translocase subunit SecDF [Pararhizobium sp.]|uniref:protein translocase subunit SecDF n=1 Tax=Pararhizobium sp. TaxID=1977563 RepID=UPI002718E685|nr:protein translocase subunit SecDF [Pararhizobium sp.]MDO9415358.1 protein translocase subunit SecDF [Pararhizobium sp.]
MLHFARWKTALIWLTVLASLVIALPNVFSDKQLEALPGWFPAKKMTLGLDLQGGSHVMLKIERGDVIKERLQATIDTIRAALQEAKIGYTGLSGSGQNIQVTISDTAKLQGAKDSLKGLLAPVETGGLTGRAINELTLAETAGGLLQFQMTDAGIDHQVSLAVSRSIDVLRRRVDALGTTDPVIRRQGADRIVVQVPGLGDPQRLKDLVSQTAKFSYRAIDASMPVQDAIAGNPPATSEVIYSIDDPPTPYLIEKSPLLSGADLVDVQAAVDSATNDPSVSFAFSAEAEQRLAALTPTAGATYAIVFDDLVLAAPVPQPVSGSSGRIASGLDAETAGDLALLLRASSLPATMTVVEERTVGPGLGADSINAGFIAGLIGAGLVIAFMFAFYGLFGLIANIAVVLNVVMIIAILSLLGFTLTLPGIAGIVLTIGMAVDANVLIYERIRENVRSGAPLAQAIYGGFSRAFATIIDANVTTFIAAIILFYLGSGSVRGFAVTLAVGLLTTVFTAFTLTRWMIVQWFVARRPVALPKGIRTGIFDGTTIRFMSFRRYTFVITAILCIGSLVLFMGNGVNFGVDFKGGSNIELKAKSGDADIGNIRDRLGELNLGDVQVQGFGTSQDALIRIASQDGGENAEQSALTKVRDELEDEYEFRRVDVVGPSVSGDLTWSATVGVLVSLGAILLYVWLRFEWQFAAGAIIATLHDVLLTLGLFALTGLEFDLTSIAAILTIVGYSLNDTIVIYDRIRENLRKYPKMPIGVLIDISINGTLSRTILTSATIFLAICALYLFGGEVIRSFAFVMLFGVVIGTFSSIYIAGPILILFRLRPDTVTSKAAAGMDDGPVAGAL